jgi:hypothetical protein
MNEDRNPTRRKFLRNSALAVGSAAIAPGLLSGAPFAEAGAPPMIWGNLLHLSYNMWCDRLLAS